jgi:hypothetical protein
MTERLHAGLASGIAALTLASPAVAAAADPARREHEPRPVVIQVEQAGFQWRDAAVGATAVLGLVLAAGGAVVVVRRPSKPQTGRETP